MDINEALDHFREHRRGVFTTIRPDGGPHVSVVSSVVVEGALWVTCTEDRVKTRNLRRNPRAAFASGVMPWAGIEGEVTIHDGDDVVHRMRLMYRAARGEHPDWEAFDRAMIEQRRVVFELQPTRAYGQFSADYSQIA